MAVILVEGCDNTGKTTLVNKLAHKTGYTVVHSKGPDKDQIKPWLNHILEKAENGENLIMDRVSLVSEQVYGPILRGDSVFGPSEWLGLWGRFMELQPKIVYCRPPREVILGTITEREQMGGVAENCRKLIDAYDNFFNYLLEVRLATFLVYDYTRHDEEELIDWVLGSKKI